MNVALPDIANLTLDQKKSLFYRLIQELSPTTSQIQFEDGSGAFIMSSIEKRRKMAEEAVARLTPEEIEELDRRANAPESEFFTAEEFLEEMRLKDNDG